jgi:hypothetical protein
MNARSERAAPAASDADTTSPRDSVAPLASGAADVIGAWTRLLNLELVLAQRSLRRLLIGAIAVPVVGLCVWLSLSALLVALTQIYTDSWLLALLLGSGVQLLALAMLLHQLQRWARDLTLPQSRAALVHAMKRMS